MSEAFVTAVDVARRFQQGDVSLEALRPATFTIRAGDRIAIVGASGSGKSTLLQLIADLDTPSSGALSWPALGASGTLRPRHIGMVFQSASLLPALSAIENVEVPLRLLGEAAAPREAALAALASVGLSAIADKLPDELSGGEQQRVAIARSRCDHASSSPTSPPASSTNRRRSGRWTRCSIRSPTVTRPSSSPPTILPWRGACRPSGAWITAC